MTITQSNLKSMIRYHLTSLYDLYHNVWFSTGESMTPEHFRSYLHNHFPAEYYTHIGAFEALVDTDPDLNQSFSGSWVSGLIMRSAMGLLDPIEVSPSADFFSEGDKARWRVQLDSFKRKIEAL